MTKQQREKIDAMLRQPRPGGPPPSVEELRAGFVALMSTRAVPSGFRTSTTTLGGRPALSVEPEQGGRPGGMILYFHGGGNVFGSPEAVLSLTAQLVVKTGLRAFSPEYRLAPEHPFPAAIEDTLSAYRALLDHGTDPSTVVFAGDSAGGGLTVTTCLPPATQARLCPPRSWRSPPGSTPPGRARAWTPRPASIPSSAVRALRAPRPCTWPGRTPASRC